MFYGQIQLRADLKSIEGMSGGPIFGLKQQDAKQARYWPYAVQSSWWSEKRIVIGVPLPLVGTYLKDRMKELL